jgi:hypothetical protein
MRMRKIGGVGELDFEQATFLLGGGLLAPLAFFPKWSWSFWWSSPFMHANCLISCSHQPPETGTLTVPLL